jgi:7TM-HD extracellular protein
MVTVALRIALIAALALASLSKLSATEFFDYKIGDIAREDIIARGQLVVIDAEETAALKQKEAGRVPVIWRYYTNIVDEVENDFRSAFAGTRSNFLIAIEEAFNQPTLDLPGVANPEFHRVTTFFQRHNKSFPMSTNLAEAWALGESDRVLQASLAAILREAMSRPIRLNVMPLGFKPGFTARLVPLADTNQTLNFETAEQLGKNLPRTNIVILEKAKAYLLESFPPEEQRTARFLASLLRPNCVLELDLTLQVRARRTAALLAADHYEAGQVIAKQGQVIDKKILAALDQLREQILLGDLQEQIRQDELKADQTEARNRSRMIGAGVIFLVLVPVIWRLARRKQVTSLLPARISKNEAGATVVSCPSCSEMIVLPDGPSEAATSSDVRLRLLPHLARLMMDKLVQKLISQRTTTIDAQQKAAAELAALEQRLAKVHAPLQDRLQAYEQRIKELEKELAWKGEENRELIKAKILIVRNQLEIEKNRVGFN